MQCIFIEYKEQHYPTAPHQDDKLCWPPHQVQIFLQDNFKGNHLL